MLAKRMTALAVAVVALGGCRVYAEPEPATSYVEVSSAPVDVSSYPSTTYDGHVVYYVNNRWMYRDRGRWVYYRREPDVLVRHRRYTQQAPPAYPYQTPPPAVPPPAVPPPAVRVQ